MKPLVAMLLAALAASSYGQQKLPPPPGTKVMAPKAADKLEKKTPEQPLPGLGVLPGEKQLTKANVVRVQSDRNEIVYVSASLANRLATPFAEPRVIDTTDLEYKTVGSSIFLIPNDPEKPVALYVTGSNPTDPVVSLTLVPKPIPQQTIVLQLDAPLVKGGGTATDEPAPRNDAYQERIRYVLRQVALNKTPEGFIEGALPAAKAVTNGAMVTPVSRYSGSAFDIYRYTIQSTSAEDIELSEEAFYSRGVRAVAFFPQASLRRGETTSVFVISDKSATEN